MLGKLKTSTGPWVAGAVVLVAGFMYWLYAESSTIQTGIAEADTTVALPHVADTTFVRDPSQFSRERVMLSPVKVAERIGRAAITVDLPSMPGYPLILERSVVEADISIVGGDFLTVAGQVYALNDSLLNVYAQRGFFDPANRSKIEGQQTFFLVDSLDIVFPEEQTSGSESQP